MENTPADVGRERLHFASDSRRNRRLAVQLFASELAIDLFELDLAEVSSKYSGETEKHLDAFFTAAEAAGAVLLIDEADALFGKRTEVRDAHDRYAHLDVDYLLQRLESYPGIVVLTTHRGANIDAACARDCERVELSDD
jgi:vesicle-fusing ATPase